MVMAELEYKFRCTIHAHRSDIRAVTNSFDPDGGIITGSRDRTIKVWRPNPDDNDFIEALSMHGASHFISCVCTLPPSEQYPYGLILAGSVDSAIYGFSLDSPAPILKLLGHSENVCAIVAGNLGTVVSGSWDCTARVWSGQRCVAKLVGHNLAVWAVALMPDHGLVLTGSADKSICLWRNEKCERKFLGHKDCVRGLAVVSESEFLSCSNDTTVRRWLTNGECIAVYEGHTDYIYDICLSYQGDFFVTCSEDQTVRVWQQEKCVQKLTLPAKSLWTVTCLINSDIAVGGSDGTVRVFTKNEKLVASPEHHKAFLSEISVVDEENKIGDLNVNEIPDEDVLNIDGTKDGQKQLCRTGGEVYIFAWSVKEGKWNKLGKVLDAHESETPSKGKTMFEGQEYDHVFTIDVAEGKILKLPYNKDDDPWLVAHKFIEKHNLNPMFLDQIANFIIKNSKPIEIEAHESNESKIEYADPFTGGSRYIPGSGLRNAAASSVNESAKDSDEAAKAESYFPLLSFITFDTANADGIKSKLAEFTEKVEKSQKLTTEDISNMILLSNFPEKVTDQQMLSLEKALTWPADFVFPALDVLRLAVRSESVNNRVSTVGGAGLINHLLRYLSNGNPVSNQFLVLRALSNFFVHASGEQLAIQHANKILDVSKLCATSNNKHVQIALSTMYLNYTVAFNKLSTLYPDCFIPDVIDTLKQFKDPEAVFRLMVCLGTAFQNKDCLKKAIGINVADTVQAVIEKSEVPKIKNCGYNLISLIIS